MKQKVGKVLVNVLLAAAVWAGARQARAGTWTGGGGDDNWSTGDNWGGTAPVAGDALVFGGTARCTNVNDLAADTSFSGITFHSDAALFSLSGNRITLGGDVTNNDGDTHRINFDMILDSTRSFILNSGSLYAMGVLSGSGGVTTKGSASSILVLAGDNAYQGQTTVDVSHLRIASGQALGTTDGGTLVKDSRRLELSGGITVTGEVVTINGNGGNYNGAIQSVNGSNTWAGPLILGSSGARLGTTSASAKLVINGVVDDGTNAYHLAIRSADNCGPVILTSTNAYDGETQVVVGTLMLAGGDNRLPTNGLVRVGNGSNVNWAKLDLNGWDQEVKGIAADGTIMSRAIGNSASNDVATLTVNNPSAYTYKGNLSGRLNLVKKGSGTLTLDVAENEFWGETAVREGALVLLNPMSIGGSTLNTGDGPMGTLSFANNTVVNLGGIVGTNDLVLTNSTGQAISLRVRGSQTTVFDGQILNGVSFTKVGGGTFTMMQANTFTGKAFLEGGTLYLPTEDALGVYPASFVQDQITFNGGRLSASTNYLFAANNRGVTIASNGAAFYMGSYTGILTVAKQLVGVGGVTADGVGVVLMTASNSYDGVTTVKQKVLRITQNEGLGSTIGGTGVETGGQLELEDGVVVTGESISLKGAGITSEDNKPPTSDVTNRGALQAARNAAAEWAGPVLLVSDYPRLGAQNGGHLIVSGVIDDGASSVQLRISTNPNDKTKGVEFRAQNTYGGSTDLTRGTLFLGVADAIPVNSVLDVHWAGSNNDEYSALDVKGFDQTLGGLKNSGNTGANAAVTNSTGTLATLTVNQASDTSYNGVIGGPIALVKEGVGLLSLGSSTCHTGSTTVRGGTLLLGANNVLSSSSPVVLDGGILHAGNATNTLYSLTVTADSGIELGAGEIAFASQGATAWSGQLNLTGTLGPTSLRFQPALTADQVSRISYDGGSVVQNAAGYIREYFGTLIIVQ